MSQKFEKMEFWAIIKHLFLNGLSDKPFLLISVISTVTEKVDSVREIILED